MRSIENVMIPGTRAAEAPAKRRGCRTDLLVCVMIAVAAFAIWSGLLLLTIPGAMDAVVATLADTR